MKIRFGFFNLIGCALEHRFLETIVSWNNRFLEQSFLGTIVPFLIIGLFSPFLYMSFRFFFIMYRRMLVRSRIFTASVWQSQFSFSQTDNSDGMAVLCVVVFYCTDLLMYLCFKYILPHLVLLCGFNKLFYYYLRFLYLISLKKLKCPFAPFFSGMLSAR